MPFLPFDEFFTFAAVISLGVFVQSATGFAGALVIISLLLWFGYELPEAQAAVLTATVPQNLLGLYQFREHVDLRSMRWPVLLRCVSLPVGVFVLYNIESFPKATVRQIVSGVVLMCVILVASQKPQKQSQLRFRWTLLAFLSSGFFAGLTGTGGPMMVLWIQTHDWRTERVRSFLFVMYLLSIPITLSLLYYSFGSRIVVACASASILVPLILIFSRLGLHCGTLLGKERLRAVTMGLLFLVGLQGLMSPLIAMYFSAN